LRFLKFAFQVLKRNWFWLKWLVALALLGYLFYAYRGQLANLLARRPNWIDLAVALLVVAASITLTFYRWYLLVWAQEFPFTVKDALRLSFIGYACNFVGPGSAGGDLIKAGLIATEQTLGRELRRPPSFWTAFWECWLSSWWERSACSFSPLPCWRTPS
jgi:uncharacterized membrane protein YbhN (UPF0104 family)